MSSRTAEAINLHTPFRYAACVTAASVRNEESMRVEGSAPENVVPEIDTSKPHPARMYDYYLGGKNHFAADRETAEKGLAGWQSGRLAARENRAFLGRAVRFLAAEAG